MHNYEIIEKIKKTNVDNKTKLGMLGDFYAANLGLIRRIAQEQCLTKEDYYDYLQLGYDALIVAVDAYNTDSKFSFMSYFRRSFKHKIYLFNLEFHYPVRIKSPEYYKKVGINFTSYGVASDYESAVKSIECDDFGNYDDMCYAAEDNMLRKSIIKILENELDFIQFSVITKIFWQNKTKEAVANEMNFSYSKTRHIYSKALKQLRKNSDLRHIAFDMFGMRV